MPGASPRLVCPVLCAQWLADYAVVGSFLTLTNSVGEAGTFALYAVINAAAVLFVCRLVPETKGRQLEEAASAEPDTETRRQAAYSPPEAYTFAASVAS